MQSFFLSLIGLLALMLLSIWNAPVSAEEDTEEEIDPILEYCQELDDPDSLSDFFCMTQYRFADKALERTAKLIGMPEDDLQKLLENGELPEDFDEYCFSEDEASRDPQPVLTGTRQQSCIDNIFTLYQQEQQLAQTQMIGQRQTQTLLASIDGELTSTSTDHDAQVDMQVLGQQLFGSEFVADELPESDTGRAEQMDILELTLDDDLFTKDIGCAESDGSLLGGTVCPENAPSAETLSVSVGAPEKYNECPAGAANEASSCRMLGVIKNTVDVMDAQNNTPTHNPNRAHNVGIAYALEQISSMNLETATAPLKSHLGQIESDPEEHQKMADAAWAEVQLTHTGICAQSNGCDQQEVLEGILRQLDCPIAQSFADAGELRTEQLRRCEADLAAVTGRSITTNNWRDQTAYWHDEKKSYQFLEAGYTDFTTGLTAYEKRLQGVSSDFLEESSQACGQGYRRPISTQNT